MALTASPRLAVAVTDLERAVEWHERALGAEVESSAAHDPFRREALVRFGASALLLVETGAVSTARPEQLGAFHVCVGVADIVAAVARLLEHGVRPSTEPCEIAPGVPSVYFRDPDGIHFQLVQVGASTTLHHVAYSVTSLESTLGWYRRVLGAEPSYRAEASPPQLAEMLEVARDSSYRVALVPVAGIHLELMQWTRPRTAVSPAADPGWALVVPLADSARVAARLEPGDEARGPAHVATRVLAGLPVVDPDGIWVVLL